MTPDDEQLLRALLEAQRLALKWHERCLHAHDRSGYEESAPVLRAVSGAVRDVARACQVPWQREHVQGTVNVPSLDD